MGTNRLNNRDRLYIRMANDGTAIASSAMWRSRKPSKHEGRFIDITSCVSGCCEAAIDSFIIFRNTTASANITEISFPGYNWTGTLANGDYLVVPLPFHTAKEVSITVDTPTGRTITTSTIVGTGTIGAIGGITLATNTTDISATLGSQYLIILS